MSDNKKNNNAKNISKKILQDHKKIGKSLIPPIKHMLGNLSYVKWLDHVLPEIVWMGMIHEKFDLQRSIKIFTCIAHVNKDLHQQTVTNLALISNYSTLTETQIQTLLKQLDDQGYLQDVQAALKPLIVLYPDCPLNKLIDDAADVSDKSKKIMLQEFKVFLKKYLFRRVHLTNLMEVNLAYMSAISGSVRYMEGVAIPNFDALITESFNSSEYNRVATSVRAQTVAHFNLSNIERKWPSYFWNRGLELDECK